MELAVQLSVLEEGGESTKLFVAERSTKPFVEEGATKGFVLSGGEQAGEVRFCACGCGEALPPRAAGLKPQGRPQRYVDRDHKDRAYLERCEPEEEENRQEEDVPVGDQFNFRALASSVILSAWEDSCLPLGPAKGRAVEFFTATSGGNLAVRRFWCAFLGWSAERLREKFLERYGLPGDEKRRGLFVVDSDTPTSGTLLENATQHNATL